MYQLGVFFGGENKWDTILHEIHMENPLFAI